jgi:AcrR family transcriptional regulator
MTTTPKISVRNRSKAKTLDELKYAIARLQKSGAKVTISAVAREAAVTPALIHNTYPDIAEQIRQIMGKATRAQRDAQQEEVKRRGEITRQLREELAKLKADYADLASVNLALQIELARYKSIDLGNVTLMPVRPREPN